MENDISKYAFVISANKKYLQYLNAFLNSLEFVKNKQDVHIVSWDLPKTYLDKLDQLSFKTIVHEVSDKLEFQKLGEGETLMRWRYELASQLKEYESVVVFDADSIVVRNLDLWFEITSKSGVIIGCGLEQKRWYGEGFEEHHRVDGKHIIPKTWNEKDICCSPLFFSPKDFGNVFSYSWHIFADYPLESRFKGPDMDALGISILKHGVQDRVIALSEITWASLHETLLKPFSHVCEMHGKLWTINGEEIWVIHGQWPNEIWKGWQIEGQMKCIDRELNGSERCKQIARACYEQLENYWKKMSNYKLRI